MFTSFSLKMLNKEAGSPKGMSKEILQNLQIREGCAIADIGSGGGYFTIEFAKIVGKAGRVYAVDNQAKNLNFIRSLAEKAGLDNIALILLTGTEMDIPEASLDLIFARNSFHHLPAPAEYFQRLRKFLKPGGKAAIIEHRPKGGFSFVAMFKHYTPVEVILREMESAGYSLVQSFDFLPEQTFNLFVV
jgi:arsenite methyltransferase